MDLLTLNRGAAGGGGVSLCLTFRNYARFRKMSIHMLAGEAETADKMIELRYSADGYPPKPFDVDELLARIKMFP